MAQNRIFSGLTLAIDEYPYMLDVRQWMFQKESAWFKTNKMALDRYFKVLIRTHLMFTF